MEWSVRGRGPIPEGIGAPSSSSSEATDVELARIVDSLAYRVLELIPQLTHDEILEALEGLDFEAPLQLYVLQKSEGMFGTIETWDPETWIEGQGPQLVRQLHGGGHYQLRVQGRRRGVRTFIKQPVFRVPGAPKVASSGPGAAPAPVEGGLTQLFSIAQAMSSATLAAITPLIKAMTEREDRHSVDPMAAFTKGLELARSLHKGAEQDESFGRTLREIVPPAMDALRGLAAASAPAAPPALAPGAPTMTGPAGPPPAWVLALQPHFGRLLQLANFYADPEHYAAQIVHGEFLTDEHVQLLEGQLINRGLELWAPEFFAFFPEANAHREWFARFWNAVADELEDDGPPEETEELEQGELRTSRDATLPGFQPNPEE